MTGVPEYVIEMLHITKEFPGIKANDDITLQLEKGDKLFLYTDGVTEATNTQDTLFGTDRMIDALNEASDAAPKDVVKHVHDAIDAFVGNAGQFDDLTMLCMEYRGKKE